MENLNEKLLGKCGFYCGACPTYIKGGCRGCEDEHTSGDCFTRDCVKEKNLNFCGECRNFPCDTIMQRPHSTVLDKDWLLWKRKEADKMENFILIRPCQKYAEQISEYRKEFLDARDSMDGTGALRRTEDPMDYIEICKDYEDPEKVPEDRVQATQFLFIRKSDDRLLGMIQVRHRFNDYLEKYAGHIGYSVRPSERRKGYAKEMLKMALPFCKEIGLDKVLVACVDGNIGSEKTILANGGVYESTVHEPDENEDIKRFWIEL